MFLIMGIFSWKSVNGLNCFINSILRVSKLVHNTHCSSTLICCTLSCLQFLHFWHSFRMCDEIFVCFTFAMKRQYQLKTLLLMLRTIKLSVQRFK